MAFACNAAILPLKSIFTLDLCWPSNDHRHWSKVMADEAEFFENRMWPQVKRKLTELVNDLGDQHWTRIHEFLFIHLLKELELLTVKDEAYYESILDMFEDEKVVFGVPFYMKLCQQFSWKKHFFRLMIRQQNASKAVDALSAACSDKTFLTKRELQVLSLIRQSDFAARYERFKHLPVGQANNDDIKKLLNKLTVDDSADSLAALQDEIRIEAYFDPVAVFELILDQALIINKAQVNFYVRILCTTLKDISSFRFTYMGAETTFLIKMLMSKISEIQQSEVQSIIEFIDQIGKFDVNKQVKCCPLDLLLDALIFDEFFSPETAFNKATIIKHIIDVGDSSIWNEMLKQPAAILAFLLQFLDSFWSEPIKKQLIIDILNNVLDTKIKNPLDDDDVRKIQAFLKKKIVNPKASTTLLYICYLESRLPHELKSYFEFDKSFHDQILHLATITKDVNWLCVTFPHYEKFTDSVKVALEFILCSLTGTEFEKLFCFLRMYYYNSEVVTMLKNAISKQNHNADIRLMIKFLIDLVVYHVVDPMLYDIQWNSDEEIYLDYECETMFKSLSSLDFMMLTNDVRVSLRELLVKLAQLIEQRKSTRLWKLEEFLSPLGKEVLRQTISKSHDEST